MFNISAKRWPGVAKLVEECNEVGQIVGKLMGMQGEEIHYSGMNLRRALIEEMADVAAAIEFVSAKNLTEDELFSLRRRVGEKLLRYEQWYREGK